MYSGKLLDICEQYKERFGGFYVGCDIPEDKIKNAQEFFPIPKTEKIIALLDGTIFGSCKHGLAICENGLYYKKQKGIWGLPYNEFFIPWEALSKGNICIHSTWGIKITNEVYINTSVFRIKREQLVYLLNELVPVF